VGDRAPTASLPLPLKHGARLGDGDAMGGGIPARVGVAEIEREAQPVGRRSGQVGFTARGGGRGRGRTCRQY
jgi:hypothetical protein